MTDENGKAIDKKRTDKDEELMMPDEERVVASMNVEGMPWYRAEEPAPKNPNAEPLTGKNLWRYALSAIGAGLAIVFAFGIAGAAFIWFCTNVWFA